MNKIDDREDSPEQLDNSLHESQHDAVLKMMSDSLSESMHITDNNLENEGGKADATPPGKPKETPEEKKAKEERLTKATNKAK